MDKHGHTSWWGLAGWAVLTLAFSSLSLPARPEIPLQPFQATPTPAPAIFLPQVIVSPREGSPQSPQDVEGFVSDKSGNGISGTMVRVASPGWEAFDTTKVGGIFRFTLTSGDFTITLVGQNSQPALVKVDPITRTQVIFRETPLATPSSGFTPTPMVTITLTPTYTLTHTPTPTATIMPETTVKIAPTPSRTPAPAILSPSPTPSSSASSFSLGLLAEPFFIGLAVGVVGSLLILLGIFLRQGDKE